MNHKLKKTFKFIRHLIEAAGTYAFYISMRLLPIERASAVAGWIARNMGPHLSPSKTARANLEMAFPDNTYQKNSNIIINVWDNFGRVMGEYPNLHKINVYQDNRFEVVGAEYIDQLHDDNKPAVLFGAHLASWEVAIMAMTQRGLKVTQMYRATNNPYVDRVVRSVQQKIGYEVINKGSADGRRIIEIMNRGENLFLLVDQKMNKGMPVPFFGRDAMTAPAAVRLAMKYDCPFVPVQVERLGGFKFRIRFHPPMTLKNTGDLNNDIYANLCQMNSIIEGWVRLQPDQWLWIHKRWPKKN